MDVPGVICRHPAVDQGLQLLQATRLVVVEEPLLEEAEEALDFALGLGVAWEVGEELDIQLAQCSAHLRFHQPFQGLITVGVEAAPPVAG